MDFQDFKPVVLRKNRINNPVIKNNSNSNNKDKYDGLVEKPKTFTIDFGKALSKSRIESNMTRKDLALKLNLKESVISDIENGKQLYDGNIVHKLKRIFPNL